MSRSELAAWQDAALVRAARDGCDDAFATLVNRYRRVVFGMAWGALEDFDDAEDAAQETFVAAYRHLGELRDGARFSSWVTSIAVNTIRKALGKRSLEAERLVRLDDAPDVPSECAGEPRANRWSYGPLELREAFGTLSQEDRATTTLFYLVGLNQQRIAEIQGVPLGTVKSRLHRARRRLKRRLVEMARERFEERVEGEDYGRAVIAGMRGVIHWQRLLAPEGLVGWCPGKPSAWTRSGDAIIGEDGDGGALLFIGDASWKDYEFSVLVTVLSGGNAEIKFRLAEEGSGRHGYMLSLLLGWLALSLTKVDLDADAEEDRVLPLSVVNFPLELGREYDVMIAARGASITTYLDGKLMNQVTDFSHRSGPIALEVWYSKAAFRDPRIRHLG